MACNFLKETTGHNIQSVYLIENLLINIRNSVDLDLPVPVGLYVFVESDGNDGRVGCFLQQVHCVLLFLLQRSRLRYVLIVRNGVIHLPFRGHIHPEKNISF